MPILHSLAAPITKPDSKESHFLPSLSAPYVTVYGRKSRMEVMVHSWCLLVPSPQAKQTQFIKSHFKFQVFNSIVCSLRRGAWQVRLNEQLTIPCVL